MRKAIYPYYWALILFSLTSFGCDTTRGRLYVGQPQVHTREGLVEERFGELEWLRGQREKSKDIVLSFQGVRDVRQFVGFHNQLKASFDPTNARLNQLDLKREESATRAEIWRQRRAELLEEHRFNQTREQLNQGETIEDSTDETGNGNSKTQSLAPPPLPSGSAPLGTKPTDFPLPDPSKAIETEAKLNILDLFHDKMTYRDAVNAAIKSTRLDDSHDRKGSMLYELTFNMSLVPGNRSEEYAQIAVAINPKSNNKLRARSLKRLFVRWREALQNKIVSEVAGLQYRYRTQTLTPKDSQLLETFFSEYLIGLSRELEQRDNKVRELLGKYLDSKTKSVKKIPESIRSELFSLVNENRLYSLLDNSILELEDRTVGYEPDEVVEEDDEVSFGRWNDRQLKAESIRISVNPIFNSLLKFVSESKEDSRISQSKKLIELAKKVQAQDQQKFFENIQLECASMKGKGNVVTENRCNGKGKPCVGKGNKCRSREELSLQEQRHQLVLKGIAWAIWSKYRELAKIINISEPNVVITCKDKTTGGVVPCGGKKEQKVTEIGLEGLTVESVPSSISIYRNKTGKYQPNCLHGDPNAKLIGSDMHISNTGFCTFLARIMMSEQKPYALIVEPKEYAQNISDVSAREDMLNLVASVHAMLPTQGVNIENNTQYVRRRQELLHAIKRRPLLVGFGQGGQRFGWVAGPKFAIEDGKVAFRHVPVRHDFSASIVVPAWWNTVHLTGAYQWIDWKGRPQAGGCLWHVPEKRRGSIKVIKLDSCDADLSGKHTIELSLPAPNDQMDRITHALLSFGPNANFAPAVFQPRPHPVITFPDSHRGDHVTIQAIKKNGERQILIQGKELWRNPQVFLGSQKAYKVEVLSNMEGLLAHFDTLPYIESIHRDENVDVRVITTFGAAKSSGVVTLLPPPIEDSGANKAKKKLPQPVRRFVDNKEKVIQFTYDQPKSYSKIVLKLTNPKTGKTETYEDEIWDTKGQFLGFDIKRPTGTGKNAGDVVQVDLIQYDRKNGKGRSILGKKKLSIARFKDSKDRYGWLQTETITFRAATKDTQETIKILFSEDLEDVLDVAYPGFKEARDRTAKNLPGVFVNLSPTLGESKSVKFSTTLGSEPGAQAGTVFSSFTVGNDSLNASVKILKKLGENLFAQLEYEANSEKSKDKKDVHVIPTLKKDKEGAGKIALKWPSPEDIRPKVQSPTINYNHAGETSDQIILFVRLNELPEMYEKYPGLKKSLSTSDGVHDARLILRSMAGRKLAKPLPLDHKSNFESLEISTRTVPENILNRDEYRKDILPLSGTSARVTIEYSERIDGAWTGKRKAIQALTADGKPQGIITVQDAGPKLHKAIARNTEVKFKKEDDHITTSDEIEFVFPLKDEKEVYRYYKGLEKAAAIWLVFLDPLNDPISDSPLWLATYSRDQNKQYMKFTVNSDLLKAESERVKEWAAKKKPLGLMYRLNGKQKVIQAKKAKKDEAATLTVTGP